eukprot:g6819.t1
MSATTGEKCPEASSRQTRPASSKLRVRPSETKKMERKMELLYGVKLFKYMHKHEVEHLAEHLVEKEFQKGDVIIREGEQGADFFLIDSGQALEVDIVDDSEEDDESTDEDAMHFRMSVDADEGRRSSKASGAEADAVECKSTPTRGSSPTFSPPARTASSGKTPTRISDSDIKATTHIEKQQFGPGMYFGERALLRPHTKRRISVQALEKLRCYTLHADDFRKVVAERNAKESMVRNCHLFEMCNADQIATIAGSLEREVRHEGEILYHQGDAAESMFLIEMGNVIAEITVDDEEGSSGEERGCSVRESRLVPSERSSGVLKTYEPGSYFGETALLSEDAAHRRASTLRSSQNSLLLRLDKADFERTIGNKSLKDLHMERPAAGPFILHAEHYLTDPRKLLADFYSPGSREGPRGMLSEERRKQLFPADLAEARATASVAAGDHNHDWPWVTNWFVVYRPCSRDSIAKMLGQVGVGKGLNIKGKSAKKNRLSAFVPFLQISKNEHKKNLERAPRAAKISVYFQSAEDRSVVVREMQKILQEIILLDEDAADGVAQRPSAVEQNRNNDAKATVAQLRELRRRLPPLDLGSPTAASSPSSSKNTTRGSSQIKINPLDLIEELDGYAESRSFGLCVPEALLRELFVERHDVSPMVGWETGRNSEPAFMDMNLHALRDGKSEPRAVLYQYDRTDPLNPLGLLMAYAEKTVRPVVSDLDTLLIGSEGDFEYSPLEEKQTALILCERLKLVKGSWTSLWLKLVTTEVEQGFNPSLPKYGFGDASSTALIAKTVDALKDCGAVRHGAECFNFFFPQELDDEYLVIWDQLARGGERAPSIGAETHARFHGKPWRNVTEPELRAFLMERVAEGFVFPLNPAWPVRAPQTWGPVWRALRAASAAQAANKSWYADSVVEEVEALMAEFPQGFDLDEADRATVKQIEALVAAVDAARRWEKEDHAGKGEKVVGGADAQDDDVASFVGHEMKKAKDRRMRRIRHELKVALRSQQPFLGAEEGGEKKVEEALLKSPAREKQFQAENDTGERKPTTYV